MKCISIQGKGWYQQLTKQPNNITLSMSMSWQKKWRYITCLFPPTQVTINTTKTKEKRNKIKNKNNIKQKN